MLTLLEPRPFPDEGSKVSEASLKSKAEHLFIDDAEIELALSLWFSESIDDRELLDWLRSLKERSIEVARDVLGDEGVVDD